MRHLFVYELLQLSHPSATHQRGCSGRLAVQIYWAVEWAGAVPVPENVGKPCENVARVLLAAKYNEVNSTGEEFNDPLCSHSCSCSSGLACCSCTHTHASPPFSLHTSIGMETRMAFSLLSGKYGLSLATSSSSGHSQHWFVQLVSTHPGFAIPDQCISCRTYRGPVSSHYFWLSLLFSA